MIVATDHHDDDGFVAVWSADDGRLLYRGPAERERRIFGAMFSADSGRLILTDFESGAIEVRETKTWTVVTTARVEPAAGGGRLYPVGYDVTESAIVAVGELLGTSGGSLHWLDPATLQPLHSPATDIHEGSLKAVALSPDRSRIATGSSDGSVRVWRTSDGGLIDEIRVPGSEVQGVAFRDDDHLVVTPADGTVRIYTLDVTELVRIARSAVTRTFTPVECARFGIDPCPTLEQLRGG
jgi:WD40 repeat protein